MKQLLSAILLLSFAATLPVRGQEAIQLEQDKPVERELAAGDKHTFEIILSANEFVYGEVDQQTVDVVVTVYNADGQPLETFDSPARGPEPFQFKSEREGTYRIEVAPFKKETGRYVMRLLGVAASGPVGLFDIGEYRLFIECAGSGSPTLILDHGQGTDRHTWDPIWSDLTLLTRTCRYDRAGRGDSEQGPVPTSSLQIVQNLHQLLDTTGVEPPYVIVGHSFGGLNAQLYAGTFPEQVEGLVLLDPSSRFYYPSALSDAELPSDPVERRMLQDFLTYSEALAFSYVASPEGVDWKLSYQEATRVATLGDLPLYVLTAGDRTWTAPAYFPPTLKNRLADLWLDAQNQIVALSSRSTHVIVERAGHFVHWDRPDAVLEAVESVLADTVEN